MGGKNDIFNEDPRLDGGRGISGYAQSRSYKKKEKKENDGSEGEESLKNTDSGSKESSK